MPKRKLTATFADGETISRVTDKNYPFAWQLRFKGEGRHADKEFAKQGFSSSRELAEDAQRIHMPTGFCAVAGRYIPQPDRVISFEIVLTTAT